jgi:hypothetical protein
MVDQARQEGLARIGGPRQEEFINEALAAPAPMHDQAFEFFELMQMPLQLRVAPSGLLAHVAAAKDTGRANSSSVSFVPTDRVRADAPFLDVAATAGKLLPKHDTRFAPPQNELCGRRLGILGKLIVERFVRTCKPSLRPREVPGAEVVEAGFVLRFHR